jgi:polyisoprenoid-binding protein YceI
VSSNASPSRRWVRWVVGAVVVVVVLAVGVPFVYIHFIEGKAPAKLALTTGAGGATVPLDGTWVVGPGSVAGYRVGEVLLGQNNTAVGRTSSITGNVVISGTTVSSATFTVDLTTVKSDESQRDGQFQGRIMDTAKYPSAPFALTQPAPFSVPQAGATISIQATGTLPLHGTTRSITVTLTARQSGATIQVLGSIPIVFADWGIPNPTFSGVAETQNHGTIEFLLDLVHGTAEASTGAPLTTSTTAGGGPLNAAFRACMAAHGAPLPSAPANGAPPTRRPGGPGGPGGRGRPGGSPAQQAALKACSSLLPAGSGFGPITVPSTTVPPLSL